MKTFKNRLQNDGASDCEANQGIESKYGVANVTSKRLILTEGKLRLSVGETARLRQLRLKRHREFIQFPICLSPVLDGGVFYYPDAGRKSDKNIERDIRRGQLIHGSERTHPLRGSVLSARRCNKKIT